MIITVKRTRQTVDGIFGKLSIDESPFTCYTCENKASAIPPGLFDVTFDYSTRFNRIMPHLWVPVRDEAAKKLGYSDAGIRIHWGNFPSNYEGCVGVGNGIEADSIDNTVATFNQLFNLIHKQQGLKIKIEEAYA